MISLYVKSHNVTGLKYFGKTESSDPCSYRGSGTYWLKHLKKHGNDVSTIIVGQFEDKEECKRVALKFSQENDIVQSKDWANLKIEELDGGFSHIDREELARQASIRMKENNIACSPEAREKIRQKAMGNKNGVHIKSPEEREKIRIANNGKKLTEETKDKIRHKRSLQIFSPESIVKRAQANIGKKRSLVSCLYCRQIVPINVFGKEYHKNGKCHEKI